jgi:alkanesulfonate monooxygenase SsuD/methylene tetrahydromethanopterin reductase-like flavin-dependent oxidoreductase (luciferase family)
VIDALLHPPVVLARRFATLDQFSGGRVVAGLGQGWMPQEFETANVPMDRIGAGMDEVVAALATTFRQAAEQAGRDPAALTVVVRANVPLTREPLGDRRPFLGGSPRQIAEDVARLEPAGLDQVLFSSIAARDLETEVRLLAQLQAAVAAAA